MAEEAEHTLICGIDTETCSRDAVGDMARLLSNSKQSAFGDEELAGSGVRRFSSPKGGKIFHCLPGLSQGEDEDFTVLANMSRCLKKKGVERYNVILLFNGNNKRPDAKATVEPFRKHAEWLGQDAAVIKSLTFVAVQPMKRKGQELRCSCETDTFPKIHKSCMNESDFANGRFACLHFVPLEKLHQDEQDLDSVGHV